MQIQIRKLLRKAMSQLQDSQALTIDIDNIEIQVERCRNPEHGDFASNVALSLAKPLRKAPREIAQLLLDNMPQDALIKSVSLAGPGFINFTLQSEAKSKVVADILQQGDSFAAGSAKSPRSIHLEFVSANPTGPLHVGHGRSAAYGSCLANLLRDAGHKVHCEYYVNDAGRQIQILGLSTWIRYLEFAANTKKETTASMSLPDGVYQGDYIKIAAEELYEKKTDKFFVTAAQIDSIQQRAAALKENKDQYIDALIIATKETIGSDNFQWICEFILEDVLADIKQDLSEFGVQFNNWFRESDLVNNGSLKASIACLDKQGYVYEKDNAKWFKATELGDEKDRVLIRANGQPTYFASDVAYHLHKYEQKHEQMIDIFGADHHGYIARIKAFLKGLQRDPEKLKILLVQFAILYRGKEKVSMSTRSGEFVTLRTLRAEVGNDAARYFYVMRKPDQHLDFDLKLAKSKSNENPVYYIQYAYARICQVYRQAETKNISWDKELGLAGLARLTTAHELELLSCLNKFADILAKATLDFAPHILAHYLQELAAVFHSYYNAEMFLVDDNELCQARLSLIAAARVVISRGLSILGISSPEQM